MVGGLIEDSLVKANEDHNICVLYPSAAVLFRCRLHG